MRRVISFQFLLFFSFLVLLIEIYTYLEFYEKSELMAKRLEVYLEQQKKENFFDEIRSYLEGMRENQDLTRLIVYFGNNFYFHAVTHRKTSWYHEILKMVYLIRDVSFEKEIPVSIDDDFYSVKTIFIWENKNFFTYQILFIVLVLVTALLYFYDETRKHKKEIIKNLNEIQMLKNKQDGDYFLTSLLYNSLQKTNYNSEVFEIKYFVKQKKDFVYKNKNHQIGGDYVFIKQLFFNERSYIFFINADAMGKSLQGANGAIILGSLILAYLNRFENTGDGYLFPENLLLKIYMELQRVFETFEGSMLVSCVLGFLDEKTHTIYFMNFEHPYPVLYRNRKATFVGRNTIMRKLGTPDMLQSDPKVEILKLERGDIFLVGSDGKDDILLKKNGFFYMNEDEELFLKLVEESDGRWEDLIHRIFHTGEVKDDVSLIFIRSTLHEEDPSYADNMRLAKQNLKELIKEKNYTQAYTLARYLIQEYPQENYFLAGYFYSLWKLKKWKEAMMAGNVLQLRNYDESRFLLLLLKSYLYTGAKEEAKKILEKIKDSSIIKPEYLQKLQKRF